MSTASLELKSPPITFECIIRDKLRPDVQRIDHEGYYPETFIREYGEAGAFYPVTEAGNFYQAIENCSLVGETTLFRTGSIDGEQNINSAASVDG